MPQNKVYQINIYKVHINKKLWDNIYIYENICIFFQKTSKKVTITTISQGDSKDLDNLFQLSHTLSKTEQSGHFKNVFWINDNSYLLSLTTTVAIIKQIENIRKGFICAEFKKKLILLL